MIRARAQFEMATHPVLVRQLQGPLISILEETLASHRYALALDQDNADTLFNTAQVLASIAEEISKDDSISDTSPINYLEEALQLLQRCLVLQQFCYTEFQEQAAEALRLAEESGKANTHVDEDLEAQSTSVAGPDQAQWASVIEPVTKDTLLDTIIVQLSTLTTLCGILGSSLESAEVPSLAWVEEYSSQLLNVQLPTLTEDVASTNEADIAEAVLLSALLEAGFRRGKIEVQTYRQERDAAFSELAVSKLPLALMANVASLFAFNTALSETESSQTKSPDLPSLRWNALGTAISNLATASKLSNLAPEDLPRTHLLRGDASLYQYQLSKPPLSYQPALKNSAALLKNAEVFYRNASRLTQDNEERDRSRIQEGVVILLQGNMEAGGGQLQGIVASRGEKWLRDHVDGAVTDGLLDVDDDLHTIGLS